MAAAPDPVEVLRSTAGKSNFLRLVRLLISGGTSLLRDIFDSICSPSNLPTLLGKPATKTQLKTAKLTKPQWDCLYPSPGVYGKSTDFDVTLLFRLLRTTCNLTPPSTGWDVLPASSDHSLTADLARIKYYRNSVYGHVNQSMEVTDDEFSSLWQEINDSLVRIARQISPVKKNEWQKAIDKLLTDPLTDEDERNVQELETWYVNDMEIKKSIEVLNNTVQEGTERLQTKVEGVQKELEGMSHTIETKTQFLESTIREENRGIKDQLGDLEELKHTTREGIDRLETTVKKVQVGLEEKAGVISEKGLCVQSVVREEAKNIKDKLETTSQEIDRLDTSLKDLQIGLKGEIGDKIQVLATTAQDIKDQLGEVHQSLMTDVIDEKIQVLADVIDEKIQVLATTAQDIKYQLGEVHQSLKSDVVDEKIRVLATTAQDIKDQLGEVHQSIKRLNSSAVDSPSAGGRLNSIFLFSYYSCRYKDTSCSLLLSLLHWLYTILLLQVRNVSTNLHRNPTIFFARHKSLQI